MNFCTMRKLIVLLASSLALLSCNSETAKMEPLSYWSDSSGMALFEVKRESENVFTISSSLGSLTGTLSQNTIRGITDLKDSFSLEVTGNQAKYSILGITIDYHKIAKTQYDSLTNSLSSN